MAAIDSRELADMKAVYLAAAEKTALAEITFNREESLWQKKISAEQDYLNAKSVLAELRIELRSVEHIRIKWLYNHRRQPEQEL